MSLRVLTLSTLFPDASRPNFGIFVERQTRELACRPNVEVTVIAPRGIPPWPLSGTGRYRTLAALPQVEEWRGISVFRPRFPIIPALGVRFHPANIPRAVMPLANRLHTATPFHVLATRFFLPACPATKR